MICLRLKLFRQLSETYYPGIRKDQRNSLKEGVRLALRLVQLFPVAVVYCLALALWVAWFSLALGLTMLSLALAAMFNNTAKALCPRRCGQNGRRYLKL
jgi:hypothetical protein